MLIKAMEEVAGLMERFIVGSGMIGEDGLLNDSCYPQRKYFTHESWSASPRFPYEGWYRREKDGGNPSCMTYGFAINELLNLARRHDDDKYAVMAERLADYIIGFQITDRARPTFGGFGTGELLNDSAHQLPMALLWLFRHTGNAKYRDSALLCLDNFVLRHHYQRDRQGKLTGAFFDYYSEARQRFESWGQPNRCAHSPLCFAFSLFAAYDLTGNLEYLEAVTRSYDWLLESYRGECLAAANGIEIGPEGDDRILGLIHRQVVPRYTGYLIHTLIGAWHYTGTRRYLDEAVRCAELVLPGQRSNGTFPLTLESEQYFPNTSNGAFGYLGGTLHLLYRVTGECRYETAAQRAVAALALDQIRNPAMTEQYGGILRKGGAAALEGMVHPFGYGWVVNGFQTLLNMQGVNLALDRCDYLGSPERHIYTR